MRKSIVTVTTPAGSKDLTKLSTLKAHLSIANPDEDTNLSRWIREASASIAKYCNRVLARETVSEQFRIGHQDRFFFSYTEPVSPGRLILARYPVATITSVTEDGVLLDPSNYEVDPDTGLLTRLRNDHETSWCARKIVVVYTGGYLLPSETNRDLPEDIEQAAVEAAEDMRWESRRNPLLKSRVVVGVLETEYWAGGAVGTSAQFSTGIQSLLDAYVDVRI